jgi:general secretion pathway protein B
VSLILDALKKAEQDRHAGQAPVIDDLLVRRPPPPSRRRNAQQEVVLMAAAIAAVLFAVAGLAYWLWPTTPKTVAVPVATAPEPAAAPVSAGPALRIDPERLEAPIATDEAVPMEDTGATAATTLDDLDSGPTAAPPPTQTPPEPATREAPVFSAPPPPPVLAEPSVRPLKEMPPAFRSEFPKLTVDVHVYDDNPLRRFVLINGKKYRETDTLMDGPRVMEITPDGVVVEQRGSKVLLEIPH